MGEDLLCQFRFHGQKYMRVSDIFKGMDFDLRINYLQSPLSGAAALTGE
jgi:hypothetical protein